VKRIVWLVLSIAIAAVTLTYALSKVDLGQVATAMAEASYLYLLPYIALQACNYLLTAVNWRLLLQPVGRFTVWQVLPSMMVGFGGNNLLPMRLGELLRTVVFARRYGKPTGAILASLVLERILDILAILVLYVISLFLIRDVPSAVAFGARLFALALIPVGVAIALFLFMPEPFMRLWHWASAWLPRALRERGTRLLEGILHGLTALQSPARVAMLGVVAIVKWFCSAGTLWFTLQAFHTGASFGVAMVVLVVSALAVALPNTPGFVGTMQAAFVLGLSPFGISPDVAFAASVFYLAAGWVPVTLAGLASAAFLGLHFSELRKDVSAAESKPADSQSR
jgi:glycosyltransferase 2 family protein